MRPRPPGSTEVTTGAASRRAIRPLHWRHALAAIGPTRHRSTREPATAGDHGFTARRRGQGCGLLSAQPGKATRARAACACRAGRAAGACAVPFQLCVGASLRGGATATLETAVHASASDRAEQAAGAAGHATDTVGAPSPGACPGGGNASPPPADACRVAVRKHGRKCAVCSAARAARPQQGGRPYAGARHAAGEAACASSSESETAAEGVAQAEIDTPEADTSRAGPVAGDTAVAAGARAAALEHAGSAAAHTVAPATAAAKRETAAARRQSAGTAADVAGVVHTSASCCRHARGASGRRAARCRRAGRAGARSANALAGSGGASAAHSAHVGADAERGDAVVDPVAARSDGTIQRAVAGGRDQGDRRISDSPSGQRERGLADARGDSSTKDRRCGEAVSAKPSAT